jgi:hypothetical protein
MLEERVFHAGTGLLLLVGEVGQNGTLTYFQDFFELRMISE